MDVSKVGSNALLNLFNYWGRELTRVHVYTALLPRGLKELDTLQYYKIPFKPTSISDLVPDLLFPMAIHRSRHPGEEPQTIVG